jgi:hypothetical protein
MRASSAREMAALLVFGSLCLVSTCIPAQAEGGTEDAWKILEAAIQGDKTGEPRHPQFASWGCCPAT